MQYPEELKYAESHEWAKLEDGDKVRMGISDFAQDALGDIVYIEVPAVGTSVTAGEPCAEVESTKSVSDVNAPATGTVVAINELLDANPETVNTDPYGEGWFVVIEASDPSELDVLMDAAGYEASVS